MSLNNPISQALYGFPSPLSSILNPPIIANVAPTVNDLAQLGQEWVDQVAGNIYFLTKLEGAQATWTAASGNGSVLSSLTVTPGPTSITGDFTLNGDNVDLSSTADMNLTATGASINVNITSDAGAVNLLGSQDTTKAVYLKADGGTNATIRLENTLSTAANAIDLVAPNGGLNINVNAFTLATVSDFTLDVAGDMTLEVDGDASSTLTIFNATGTDAASVLINSTLGGIQVTNDAAGEDILIKSDLGSVQINSGENVDEAIAIAVNSGTDATIGINNLTGTNDTSTITDSSIHIGSLHGGVGILAGIDIRLDPATTLTMAPSATVATIDLGNITPTTNRTTTINGNVVNAAHVDTVAIAPGGVSTSGSAEKHVTIANGATAVGLTLVDIATGNVSAAGNTTVNVGTGNAPVGTTQLIAIGTGTGGGTKTINLGSAADSLTSVNAFGIVDINTPGVTGATTIGNTASGGAVAINSSTTITDLAPNVRINNSGTGATTIGNAAAGGAIVLTTNTSVGIDAKTASHFTVTGAANLLLSSTGGEVAVTSAKAADSSAVAITAAGAASGITLNSSDALGTILLTTGAGGGVGGLISVANNTVAGTAGPSATVATTNNTRVGKVTYAGYTQAASATLVITLTNSFITSGSVIFASMTDASSNTTLMTLSGIKVAAGSAVLTFTNNGAQAVNGNLQLNFWVLS